MGYVFVTCDYSEVELVLEREVIKANLGEGATGRVDLTLHASGKVFPRRGDQRIYISCRREKQRKERLIV